MHGNEMDIPMYNGYLDVRQHSTASKPSGRKGSKKVRTGCITCKVRKVKCDEAKPFCLRCVKTGRKCDGYVASQPRSSTDVVRSPNLVEIDSPAGRRAFDYYRSRSAALLGGSVDASFWGGLVLRLSVTEPAVQHAVLALSSLHEGMSSRRDHGRQQLAQAFTFAEYGKAITAMRAWDSTKSPMAIPLLVCVLFTCIEFMMDHDATSQLHICQGREILARMQESQSQSQSHSHSPMADLIRRELVPVYVRLSLASFLFGSKPAPIPHHLRSSASVPDEFSSLGDARSYLYHLMDEGLQFTAQGRPLMYSPDPDPGELSVLETTQQTLLSELRQWQNAFTVLATKLVPSQSSTAMQSLLQVHHHTTVVWVTAALSTREQTFDTYTSSFASIVSLASTIVNAQSAAFKSTAFTFETELIAPLYWVVLKCRHPMLRRSALRLLRRGELKNRRENLWDASVVAAVATRVLEVEEGDVAVDWPAGEGTSGGSPTITSSNDGAFMSADHSDMASISSGAVSVPMSGPPTLPAPYMSRDPNDINSIDTFLATELVDFNALRLHNSSPPSPSPTIPDTPPWSVHASRFITETPYGIPEGRRVQNTLIGPRVPDGVYVTMFKFPAGGEGEWNIKKEFLRV